MSLVERLTNLKSRLSPLNTRFGVPQYSREVVIRTKNQVLSGTTYITTTTDTLVSPNPRVETVPPRMVGLETSPEVFITNADMVVSIVRNTAITGDIEYLILDPVLDNSRRVVGGKLYTIIYSNSNELTSIELICRRYKDHKGIITPSNSIL